MIDFSAADAEALLGQAPFLRLLAGVIQSGGLCGHQGGGLGQMGRDPSYYEGRRALALEIVVAAHAGQSEAVRGIDSEGLTTLRLAITAALDRRMEGAKRERRRPDRDE